MGLESPYWWVDREVVGSPSFYSVEKQHRVELLAHPTEGISWRRSKVGTTYQRMMNTVFGDQIGRNMEVYMDDMIAKSLTTEDHVTILNVAFDRLRKINMCLNPEKCTFRVEAGKFLGFLLISWGIEANPTKCQAFIDMRNPRLVKEVEQLNGRTTIKSQVLSDFVAELTAQPGRSEQVLTIYIDGSSNPQGSGARVLLGNVQGVTIEHSLTFTFYTSNNQAEYEACIFDLQLVREIRMEKVSIYSDSQLAFSHIMAAYQNKDVLLGKYLAKVKELMAKFETASIQHVPREQNIRAEILSKLASTKSPSNNRSVVQGTVLQPSVITIEQIQIPDD
ncbi:PREDICTED: uncharacterized protein LOC109350555 [Lupinus angustifolius]|uniref:uncharacterized protein LOC109350555 n=1 Tax=Lupinus angustifolius TaxID=3871 RepID=UPI00092E6F05|nr:PREDICTED: uncharacterized protein LOC109350555 [Lupinus angustifolius]